MDPSLPETIPETRHGEPEEFERVPANDRSSHVGQRVVRREGCLFGRHPIDGGVGGNRELPAIRVGCACAERTLPLGKRLANDNLRVPGKF